MITKDHYRFAPVGTCFRDGGGDLTSCYATHNSIAAAYAKLRQTAKVVYCGAARAKSFAYCPSNQGVARDQPILALRGRR